MPKKAKKNYGLFGLKINNQNKQNTYPDVDKVNLNYRIRRVDLYRTSIPINECTRTEKETEKSNSPRFFISLQLLLYFSS